MQEVSGPIPYWSCWPDVTNERVSTLDRCLIPNSWRASAGCDTSRLGVLGRPHIPDMRTDAAFLIRLVSLTGSDHQTLESII